MTFHIDTTCRLCSGPLVTVLDLPPTPPANALLNELAEVVDEYPLTVAQCTACDHVQLSSVVDPSVLFTAEYPYASATSPVFTKHLQDLAEEVGSHLSVGSLLVEIGSNDGTFLSFLTGVGARVIGIDPATNMARAATENGRLTFPGFFDAQLARTIRASLGRAQCVVALNVFAHSPDLKSMAEGISELLADRGTLVIEVGYLPDVINRNGWPALYHEHFSVWHLRPMRAFLKRYDLHIFDAHRIETQGGSLRVYATKGVEINESERMQLLLKDEAVHLQPRIAYWQDEVDASAKDIMQAVRKLKSEGKRIAGFGAAAKAVTLLAAAGLTGKEIDFVADDNPHKQGKFLPGSGIPILPASELQAQQPDYVLILAGNFSESIRERNPGPWKWIDPLPEVRIL